MKAFLLLAIVMTQTPNEIATHDYVVSHGMTFEDCMSALEAHKATSKPIIDGNIRVSTTFACTKAS